MYQDRQSLKRFLEHFADMWKTNDGNSVAELFVADGSLVNPFGQRADGRNDIAAMYSDYFTGMLQGTTTTATLSAVRYVAPDYAFIDAEQIIFGPDESLLLAVHLAALLRCQGDSWQFADSRPYAYAHP
jgi:uncharacterized protein (TIGR02246 family)